MRNQTQHDVPTGRVAEMVYLDLPITERIRRSDERGFEVEIWDWTAKDIDALAATGARFSSMTGYISGNLTETDGAAEFLRTAARTLAGRGGAAGLPPAQCARHRAGRQRHAGHPDEHPTPAMWLTAAATLTRLADLGANAGRVFCLRT